MYWDQLTSPQIDSYNRSTPVILPISATEQHGAHLPLATDRMIGDHFCQKLNEQIPEEVLILPNISVGCSEHHTDFAGSLSVQHVHFINQLTDISNCVVKYGFKNILVFNSHGGNQAVGQTFMETFGYRNPEVRIAMATWWRIALGQLAVLNESGKGGCGHAGEFETSLMLVIAPELVQMKLAAAKTNVPTFDWAEGDLLYGSEASLYRTMKEMTPSGVYGDPQFATRDKGLKITNIVTDKLKKIVQDLGK